MFLFIHEILILFIIAGIGYIGAYRGTLNKHSDQLMMQLVLYITLPALILYSMNFAIDFSIFSDFLWLISLSVVAMLTSILICFLLVKKLSLQTNQEGVFHSLVIFGNQGFIGYAVVYMLFGELGIMYGAIYNICFLIIIWTYGIYIMAKTKENTSLIKLLKNPGLIATILGLGILFSPFSLPNVIHGSFESVGMMTIPLSMMIIGSIMAKLPIHKLRALLKNKYLWLGSFLKLLILPMSLIPFLYFSVPFTVIAVAVLIAAMPSAPTTTLFAKKYGCDVDFAAVGVSLSTVLSIFTLPFIYGLLLLLVH